MSGIVFLSQKKEPAYCTAVLHDLTHYLSYRGPDGTDHWHDMQNNQFIGLGQAQLHSTFSSYNEKCPFHFENKFHIVSDSRIDRKEDLIPQLKSDFPFVNSKTPDSELILFSYIKWQEQCVEHLIGDFAFFIWDSLRKSLFAARNHTGSIPLYYSKLKDGILLSNTLNCVKRHPEVSLELNYAAIGDFLLFRQNWDMETTTFQNIFRIPPGSYLVWKNNTISITKYWQAPETNEQDLPRKTYDYYEEFLHLLTQAVSDRINVPEVDVMLSGGMDSSSVTAIAHSLIRDNALPTSLKAFTVTHHELFDDKESYYTKKICEHLNIPLTLIPGEKYIKIDYTKKLDFPEPSVRCHQSTWNGFIDRISSAQKPPVILTGFGADPLFSQDPNYWLNQLLKMNLYGILRDTCYHIRLTKKIPRYINRNQIKYVLKMKQARSYPDWFNPAFEKEYALKQRNQITDEVRKLKRKIIMPFWSYLQVMGDPDQLMLPVKFVHPFLDIRLIDFCSRLPAYPYCAKKQLLRKTVEPYLPKEVIARPKTTLPNHPVYMYINIKDDKAWLSTILESNGICDFINTSKIINKLNKNKLNNMEMHYLTHIIGLINWLKSNKEAANGIPKSCKRRQNEHKREI